MVGGRAAEQKWFGLRCSKALPDITLDWVETSYRASSICHRGLWKSTNFRFTLQCWKKNFGHIYCMKNSRSLGPTDHLRFLSLMDLEWSNVKTLLQQKLNMYAKRTKSIKFCRFQNRNDGFSGVSLNHPSIMLHSLPKIIGAKKKATLLLLCSPFCALRIQQLSWETATLQAKIMKSKKVQEKRGSLI